MRKMTCPKCNVLVELRPENIDVFHIYTCKCGCITSSKAKLYKRKNPKVIEP